VDQSVAITGMGGSFPGAPDIPSFLRRVRAAQPAPLTPTVVPNRLWSAAEKAVSSAIFKLEAAPVETAQDMPDSSVDANFTDLNRPLRYGRAAIAAALRSSFPVGSARPGPSKTALVVAATGAPDSYFAADAAAYWRASAVPAYTSPVGQLHALAEPFGIGDVRLSVDAACASALYAVELGVGLLASGTADAVVVLGLNVDMPEFAVASFGRLGALSTNGAILPFAADAAGMLLGEAAAAIVLEHAERARYYERHVAATLVSIGLSSDGAERSTFAPGIEGQLRAYDRAYRTVDPASVGYIEAHGTATAIGDLTEIESLDRFFGPSRQRGRRLPVGSVKALVGHSLAAAGMASIIKAIDVLETGQVPPHVPIEPNAKLLGSCLDIPRPGYPGRPAENGPWFVGVSSFGFGGSNAHLVLDRGRTERVPDVARPSRAVPRVLRLQVADFEVVMGDRLGRDSFTSAGAPLPAPPSPARFSMFADEDRTRLGAGIYFPAELTIPVGGLRMGPKMMARIDPLQAVASELTVRLMRRNSSWVDSEQTAIAVAANLGGETALRISRQHHKPAGNEHGEPLDGYLELEHIASGMPSMCSGYPAAAANARGFHATYGGADQTFLHLLGMAGHWLSERADALLVGAAHSVRSPLDARPPSGDWPSAGSCEVFGMLLLARPQQRIPAPVADLSLVLIEEDDTRPEQVRSATGFRPGDAVAVCELVAAARPVVSQGPTLHLDAAAGIQALLSALAGDAGRTGIEFRCQDRVVAFAVIDRKKPAGPPAELVASAADRAPSLSVRFGAGADQAGSPVPAIADRRYSPPESDAPPTTVPELPEFLRIGAAVVERSIQTGAALVGTAAPRPSSLPPGRRNLTGGAARPELASPHPLLADVRSLTGPLPGVEAAIQVNIGDPYFFDHPLDHVPAVLLVEAAYRLALRTAPPDELPVRLDMSFLRFCELADPLTLELRRTTRDGVTGCQVRQHGRSVAQGRLRNAQVRGRPEAIQPTAGRPAPTLDPARVHKLDPGNVFIAEPRPAGAGRYRCELALPPGKHVLLDASSPWLSPTVLLEAFRQLSTLGAHEIREVEKGRTMVQLSFHVRLDRPLRRDERLELETWERPMTPVQDVDVANISAIVLAGHSAVGALQSRAFLTTPESYARLRKVPS
jgi:hypothetical protein